VRRIVRDDLPGGFIGDGVAELARELAEGDAAKREMHGALRVLALVLERSGGNITLTRAELEDVQLNPDRSPVLSVHHDPEADAYTIRAARRTP
jgi:hypothetical protein